MWYNQRYNYSKQKKAIIQAIADDGNFLVKGRYMKADAVTISRRIKRHTKIRIDKTGLLIAQTADKNDKRISYRDVFLNNDELQLLREMLQDG